ncbi:MAG TPA: hypothetical protein VK939_08905, partial [Longimicrobiales bacterium]|nr:hypothetical protein [Longimicrobiales bacterium]
MNAPEAGTRARPVRSPRRAHMLAVLACLLPLVPGTALAAQATTRLLGRIVSLDGAPVREVRLRVLDHGEATVYDSGEFEVQLSGQPPEVRVEVIGPELEVLYPVG